MPRTALVYSSRFEQFSYGSQHPFQLHRYGLALELLEAYGLLDLPGMERRDCAPVTDEQILSFHTPAYLKRLKEFSASDEPRADFMFGLGDADCPVFKGLYDYAALGAGATLEACRLIEEERFESVLSLAGGWHHGHPARASGFCYLNDAVIAINWLRERGRRVAYLDLDAHHGDGVQEGFYADDQVLTISLHESGVYFFPGTGFEDETGIERGQGYSVNLPLLAHTDDPLYMRAFDEVVYPLLAAFNPDIIVAQIGADAFRTDPLTRLEITTHSYAYIMRKLQALQIPWVALGGGGYDLMNTARAWTIAWGAMNKVALPPRLPAAFVKKIRQQGYPHTMLLDALHWADEHDRGLALDALERSINVIKKQIFPVIIGGELAVLL
ncbi:acetoin utilization protein AcuC [Trichlorobacter lovleyi]|uniref:acetoin utilization protein AcuC n=1 Tax=Trichlorobacter lovleyi TaxID=313985 RepID=UPI00248190C4|nr:acetoin utilization protein AcuC [Trichlorobacter lovleyi]